MNNNVQVYYVPEEEKLASFERKLELERKVKRRIDWNSIGQKCLGILLLALCVISYKLTKIDGEFWLAVIATFFFGVIALLGSGSIYENNYEWEEV